MRASLLLALAASILAPLSTAQDGTPFDLSSGWEQWGLSEGSTWTVHSAGAGVTHRGDGGPSFFVSPYGAYDYTLTGTVRVDLAGADDDDYVGLLFGYSTPRRLAEDDYDFFLLDWKRASEPYGAGQATEGFRLLDVDCRYDPSRGTDTSVGTPGDCDFDAFFTNTPVAGYDVLATDSGGDLGWEPGLPYTFTLRHSPDSVRVTIAGGTGALQNGRTVVSMSAADAGLEAFRQGSVGFYSLSQSRAVFRDVVLTHTPEVFPPQEADVVFARSCVYYYDPSICTTATEGGRYDEGQFLLDLNVVTDDGEPLREPVEVTVIQTGGTATAADFAASDPRYRPAFDGAFPFTFTLPIGADNDSTFALRIPLAADGEVEGTETATFELVNASGRRSSVDVVLFDGEAPVSGTLRSGTCGEPLAVPSGGGRCRLEASGTNLLPVAQRFTVFLRLDGPGEFTRVATRGEIKLGPGGSTSNPFPLRVRGSDPDGAYDAVLLAEAGSVAAPSSAAVELDRFAFLKGGAGLRVNAPLAAFPNPAADAATLRFAVAEASEATLVIYDALGREVARPVEGSVEGVVEAALGASALPAGLYVARLVVADRVETVRLSIVR